MGGASTGGESAGGSSGSAGTASGGASAGAGGANGGAGGASDGAGGASGGTGGGGACVKNLACELDPPPSTGDLAQDCVDRINQFLTQCACLPALKRRKDGEACANEMAKYDADHDMAHAGIRAKICEPGGTQNSCPGYSSNKKVIGLCMQQMWDEGPPPTANCTGDCYEMHGHFLNMTDDSVTQVACGFYTTSSGKVWAVQNFTR
ncbi:CAP domain-containing protein [Sorangium sp. So ce367]|uniref:CAP domain-containing protein n=1 Tax=Sorangium sp. So ce367 TaxID=3133305 RepID=UPI003F62FDAC